MPESFVVASSHVVVAGLSSATTSSATALSSDGTNPDPLIAPRQAIARVPLSVLPSLHGGELLNQLALLTPSQLSSFAESHPEAIDALIVSPPTASVVASDWAHWSESQRAALLQSQPRILGSLEGVPYEVRDLANRNFLRLTERDIQKQLDAGVGRAARDELRARLAMMKQVRTALLVGPSGNSRQLVSLDPSGQGRAVIAVGDPTTADYVDYLIPGMFSDVDTQIVVLAGGADTIVTEQKAWLKKLNPGVAASQLPTVATFAWIGYQTPNLVNVASMQLARQGQASLTASIEGLRSERTQLGHPQPYVAILAHSYGSTAAMLALQDDAVQVDALAIVGSPGSPAQSARDLKVTGGNVWVGAAATDPVPQTGMFGSQPLSPSYGAHRFGVDGATDPITGKSLLGAVGHNDYFVTGSESMRNMVLIGIGRGDLVLGTSGQLALPAGKARAVVPRGPEL